LGIPVDILSGLLFDFVVSVSVRLVVAVDSEIGVCSLDVVVYVRGEIILERFGS